MLRILQLLVHVYQEVLQKKVCTALIHKSENYLHVNRDVFIHIFYTKIFTFPQKYILKPSTYLLLSIPIKLSYYYLL